MIKVRLYSNNAMDDICEALEKDITNHKSIEKWICDNVSGIDFDCMDFPYDQISYYDLYFISKDDDCDARKLYDFLKQELKNKEQINFLVSIVDEKLN